MKNQEQQVCLYIATHNKTGLKYFGKTTRYFDKKELLKYKGSGTYWNNHLKVHGDDVTMEIYGIYKKSEVKEVALKFSEENNIVEALNESGERKGKKVWANLTPENGLDGGATNKGKKMSEIQKIKISNTNKGKKPSINNNKSVSEANKNKSSYKNNKGEIIRCDINDIRIKTGELVHINNGRKPGNALNINIFDEDGNIFYECNGNFKKICKKFNLPVKALSVSYRNSGEPIYNSNFKLSKADENNKKYKGWFAKIVK